VKPYPDMTVSELNAVMIGGFNISGSLIGLSLM
jgi:hypothetical protein